LDPAVVPKVEAAVIALAEVVEIAIVDLVVKMVVLLAPAAVAEEWIPVADLVLLVRKARMPVPRRSMKDNAVTGQVERRHRVNNNIVVVIVVRLKGEIAKGLVPSIELVNTRLAEDRRVVILVINSNRMVGVGRNSSIVDHRRRTLLCRHSPRHRRVLFHVYAAGFAISLNRYRRGVGGKVLQKESI
jgi:hypothetical protein